MIDHRKNIRVYIEAAEQHLDNPLIAEHLHEFWKAYDKLVAVTKLVDDGEIHQAKVNQPSEVERVLEQWKHVIRNNQTPFPLTMSSRSYGDNPNWEEDEFKGK